MAKARLRRASNFSGQDARLLVPENLRQTPGPETRWERLAREVAGPHESWEDTGEGQASSRGEAKDSALLSSRVAGLLEPPERPQGSPASSSVWREDPGLLSRPCRSPLLLFVLPPSLRDRLPTPIFLGFPGGSAGKEGTCNAGDLSLFLGLEDLLVKG